MSVQHPPQEADRRRARPLLTVANAGAWLIGLAAFMTLTDGGTVRGLLFVVLGVLALALAAHGSGSTRGAPAPSSRSWQSAARDAWLTGGVGSVLFFVRALSAPSSSIGDVAAGMAMAAWPAVWGLALAMFFTLLGTRAERSAAGTRPGRTQPRAWERALGYVLFLGLIVATTARMPFGTTSPGLQAWRLLAHWPAVLLVAGAALMGIVVVGKGCRANVAAPACALAGTLGGLVGLALAMTGFAQQDIGRVTAGVSFMITACCTGLLGVLASAGLREDHGVERRREGPSVIASSWVLFPLVALLFLVVVFLLVITPMTKRG